MEDLRVLILLGFIESTLLTYVGPGLVGVKLPIRKTLTVGITHATLIYLLRSTYQAYDLPFGTHTLICATLLILSLRLVGKLKWSIAIAGSFLGFQLLLISEAAVLSLVIRGIPLTAKDLADNPWFHIVLGWAIEVPLAVAALIISRLDWHLLRILKVGAEREDI